MARRSVATMKDDIVVDHSPLIDQYLPPKPIAPESTSPPSSTGQAGDQGDKLNRKQVLLQNNIDLRKKFESMVLEWQEILCDPVDIETLGEAANRIKRSHYEEIIEERNIGKLCGYPLCPNPPRVRNPAQPCFSTGSHVVVLGTFVNPALALLHLDPYRTSKESSESHYKNLTDAFPVFDSEFQAQHGGGIAPNVADTRSSQAFVLPEHNLESVPARRVSSSAASSALPSQLSSASKAVQPPSSTPEEEYVQSLLASIPDTPSSIRIVEHDTTGVNNMDHEMQDEYEDDEFAHHNHESVDGYLVPVRNSKPSLKRGGIGSIEADTRALADNLAQVSLSDQQQQHQQQQHLQPQGDHIMRRVASSSSMDTRE
ncbi:RNA polymerase II associated protein 2 [Dissophora globulifera]|uniref:RNA polymerase II subunit B1 CTD phosphatase RPAP2 homolog n=1 Tax=Dissophora globulifera TaxID=979702 RepID=A0A9P6UYT6_9FUNG|nr:RNA polymerase II associated protein 2 [Dissophora globulifera]